MRTVIVISRCLDHRPDRVNFHFKGCFAGLDIKALNLRPTAAIEWREGEEYILYVKVEKVENGVLVGEVLRSRLLDEMTS